MGYAILPYAIYPSNCLLDHNSNWCITDVSMKTVYVPFRLEISPYEAVVAFSRIQRVFSSIYGHSWLFLSFSVFLQCPHGRRVKVEVKIGKNARTMELV